MGKTTRRTRTRALLLGAAMALAGALVLVRGQAPVTAQTATPDILVKSFTATVKGSAVDYALTVCVNNALPGTFQVKIWLDLASTPTCTTPAPDVDAPLTFSGLGCLTIPLNVTGLSPGSYTTRVLVDGTCAVTETSETNNTGAASFAVVGAVTYKTGPAKYVGVSAKKHRGDAGTRAMDADCHATHPGSRLCRDVDIARTFPAPQPPEDAWILPTLNGPHTVALRVLGGTRPRALASCSRIANGYEASLQPFTYVGGNGMVLAATGKTTYKQVSCTRTASYPAACCAP